MGLHAVSIEIERKFLVANEAWRQAADQGVEIVQGYLVNVNQCSVRVRMRSDGVCTLTTKLPHSGFSRYEFEHTIDQDTARDLMSRCGEAVVDKVRYKIEIDGLVWEIDAFKGLNAGLTVAEVELEREDQPFTRPDWLGEEVTGTARYQNSMLARHPYRDWPERQDRPPELALSDLA